MPNIENPIICGPMLRKVTKDSVSVFVALGRYARVTLRLYYENDNKGQGSPMGEVKEIEPKRIGKKLWVLVITLDTSNLILEIGKNYFYDILLSSQSGVDSNNLSDFGFLDKNNSIIGFPLGYETGVLPSFSLSPELKDLNIIHGSCRKPHGHGQDQLAELDNLIENSYEKPLSRPHQLFLTGDQIYADDVTPELLQKLTSSGRDFLGISEQLSHSITHDFSGNDNESKNKIEKSVKERKQLIKETTFTSTESDYHLVFLAEFYAMYLFVWSGYLSNEILPLDLGEDGSSTFPQINLDLIDSCKIEKEMRAYSERVGNLTSFCNSLGKVRRALANVSTYMIFDDHDVTDDWNINEEWKRKALLNPLTSQIIKNSLVAYAIFQDWGNQPEKYQNSDFWESLEYKNNTISFFKTSSTNNKKLEIFLGLSSNSVLSAKPHSWNFHEAFYGHDVFVLDTRTQRKYISENKKDYVALVDPNDFEIQMPPQKSTEKLAVVISPAPVLGMPLIEDNQRRFVELCIFLSRVKADYETWAGDPTTFTLLLEHLSQYEFSIILSGDVHYGYTNSCSFFKGDNGNSSSAKIVQLCSSSLKNKSRETTLVENIFDCFLKEKESRCYYDSNIVNDNKILRTYSRVIKKTSNNITIATESEAKEFREKRDSDSSWNPSWFYEEYFFDYYWHNPRTSKIKNFPTEVIKFSPYQIKLSLPPKNTLGQYIIEYLPHEKIYNDGGVIGEAFAADKILGESNIGQISFEVSPSINVIHQLYSRETKRGKDKEKLIFSCKTILSPSASSKKPLLNGDIIL